jgi:Tfp pilus assembly PilM family ATPase
MAKSLTSVIGVDVGRHSLKSVLLQKKSGGRIFVTHYASQLVEENVECTPDELSRLLKALLKQMGGSTKACAVAVNSPDALVRIIDQPETPPEILRDALKLNGVHLLNQDTREFVLDCDEIPVAPGPEAPQGNQRRYLVAGMPRAQIAQVGEVIEKSGAGSLVCLQLTPISVFNGFEFAHADVFNNHAFFLLDIGHEGSTMMLGSKRELVLIRNIEFGGRAFVEALCALSNENREVVLSLLENEDELMMENARIALNSLTREIGSSIGFFEGRREETISKIWISGGLAKGKTVLRLLGEELRMPCVAWKALERCENAVASSRRERFEAEMVDYSVACGVAAQLLKD